jgi:3-hydroxybutyryl-CoA dehydratase
MSADPTNAAPIELGPITITDVVRFAGAGGDFNPLHHDESVAQAAGFPTVIAMGQMQAAMLARVLSDRYPLASVREYRVRFAAPVRPGDTLTLTAEEQPPEEGDDPGVQRLNLAATRDDGVVAVRATAIVTAAR